ncbi:hypothetical protein GCM10010497_33480 [Streptomyces cinereoruber]|uniref:Uncharacterized protein n=1 Tax=Streptomyces cinereoruber TaxID=67260 RepID=A0AAV4KN77_9ACTN|nr:hypothetical protein GCM10010497_33480 [Streptomyces cinereoruber]
MVAFWRCVPASPPEESGGAVAAVAGSSAVAVSHRSTGYQGISDPGRPLPATRGSRVFTDGDANDGVAGDIAGGRPVPDGERGCSPDWSSDVTGVINGWCGAQRILLGHGPPSRPADDATACPPGAERPGTHPGPRLVADPPTADTLGPRPAHAAGHLEQAPRGADMAVRLE